jgi:hypothetical protein
MTSPRWQRFERLAEKIASDLAPFAEVTWDARVPGQQSGLQRQIDVLVRWRDNEDEYITIIDCKDWRTPADVVAVGAFASVVQDVQATKGILVCNAGFAETVHEYARNLGLSLVNLHDAESREWSRDLTVPLVWIDLEPTLEMQFEAYFEGGDVVTLDGSATVSPDEGTTQTRVFDLFEHQWNAGMLPRTVGEVHCLQVDGELWLSVRTASGAVAWRPVHQMLMRYEVNRKSWLGQFRPEVCRGLIDYLDGQAFQASYLPASEIPMTRSRDWEEIEDPEQVVLSIRGTVVTTEGFEVVSGSGRVDRLVAQYLGADRPS